MLRRGALKKVARQKAGVDDRSEYMARGLPGNRAGRCRRHVARLFVRSHTNGRDERAVHAVVRVFSLERGGF